jgi:hypothetical protein
LPATGREQPEIVTARSKPLGNLEGGRRSRDVEQLEPRVKDDGNNAPHGRFCAICVISDSIAPP